MSTERKAKHRIDELAGKAKQALGKAADDKSTETEGRAQRAKGSLGRAADKVRDATKR